MGRRLGVLGSLLIAISLAVPPAVQSCSPDFPFAYVWQSHPEFLLDMPEVDFKQELAFRHDPGGKDALNQKHVTRTPQLEIDCAEFQAALRGLVLSPKEATALTYAYREMRLTTSTLKSPFRVTGIADELRMHVDAGYAPYRGKQRVTTFVQSYVPLLEAFPEEFSLYAEGAMRYRLGDFEGAIARWEALLALPADRRNYRSTWAAFMLGKAYLQLDPTAASQHFENTRKLASEGFSDSLQLAVDALGWQAQAEILLGDFLSALHHYVEQMEHRDVRTDANFYSSLHFVCRRICQSPQIPETVVRDPLARDIVTLWILSGRGSNEETASWTDALAAVPDLDPSPHAGRMAHLFYQQGNMPLALTWAERAMSDDAIAQWVRAKLYLREGKLTEAETLLGTLSESVATGKITLPHNCGWRDTTRWHLPVPGLPQNDLGAVRLEQEDFAGALRAFLDAGSVYDATYIAEQVMTVEELAAFLANTPGAFPSFPVQTVFYHGSDYSSLHWQLLPTRTLLEYALARKLARTGRFHEARPYYPEFLADRIGGSYESPVPLLEYADSYARLKVRGITLSVAPQDRAAALFDAAFLSRKWGMELLGTEHAPDWRLFDGHYRPNGMTRLDAGTATPVEAERIRANQPEPNQRFHYRVESPELMWKLALLLPDNDEKTAQALWYGGKWAQRAGEDADKFYKALVRRCRKLPIGQLADEKRWFPDKPEGWP